jgi:hypothetical protein
MTPASLISTFAVEGVTLYLDGDRLLYRAMPGALTAMRREQISSNRAAIIAELAEAPTPREILMAMGSEHPSGYFGLFGPAAVDLLKAVERWERAAVGDRPAVARAFAEMLEAIPRLQGGAT